MKSSETVSYGFGGNFVVILLPAYFLQKVNQRMKNDLYFKLNIFLNIKPPYVFSFNFCTTSLLRI